MIEPTDDIATSLLDTPSLIAVSLPRDSREYAIAMASACFRLAAAIHIGRLRCTDVSVHVDLLERTISFTTDRSHA